MTDVVTKNNLICIRMRGLSYKLCVILQISQLDLSIDIIYVHSITIHYMGIP